MNPHILLFTDTNQFGSKATRPGGIYKVASLLRKNNYRVLVNPFCVNLTLTGWKEILKKYKTPDLIWIGFSTTFLTADSNVHDVWKENFFNSTKSQTDVLEDFKKVKKNISSPKRIAEKIIYEADILDTIQKMFDVPVVIGGSQLTRNPNLDNLKSRNKQIIFAPGYVEDIIVDITNDLSQSRHWRDTRKNPYVFNRENYRRQTFLFTDDDQIQPEEWLPLEINRGCAFKCTYCTYDHIGQKDHYKLSDTLNEEIRNNHDKFGTMGYFVLDDLYNDSQEKIKDLHDNVFSNLPFRIEWNSYIRLDLIWRYKEQADILYDSGLRACNFGIETLNDRAGRLVGKGLGRERIISTLEFLNKKWGTKILKNGLWIAGLPYESPRDWQNTLDLMMGWDYTFGNIWNPLFINYKYDSIHKSVLDLDYHKYGYEITPKGWRHCDGYDENDAKSFSHKANLLLKHKNIDHYKYGSLRSVGLKHEEIVFGQISDLEKKLALSSFNKRRTFNRKFIN